MSESVGRGVFYRHEGVGGTGYVLEDGRKGLLVQRDDGTRERIPLSAVQVLTRPFASAAAAAPYLATVREESRKVDLSTAWELLIEEGPAPVTLDTLIELCGSGVADVHRDAVLLALHDPDSLFRRKADLFEPVSRKVREERQMQARRTRERQEALQARVEEFRALLAAAASEAADAVETGKAQPPGAEVGRGDFRDGEVAVAVSPLEAGPRPDGAASLSPEGTAVLAAIRQCALDGQPNAAASPVLSALYPSDTRPYPVVSFDLMVKLGLWSPHQDLNLLRHDIPVRFSSETEEEARALAATLPGLCASRPMIDVSAVAIDDPDTQEVDDALALVRTERGYDLHVLICDVASAVPADGPVDLEARHRATTVYHPVQRLPMIPERLSHDAASLVPGRPTLVLDHVLHLDSELKLFDSSIRVGTLVLERRMTYHEAEALLESTGDDWAERLQLMWRAAGLLMEARQRQGAVQFYPPETRYRLIDGKIEIKRVDMTMKSRRLVAELMVAAGACVGSMLADRKIPAIYRVQPVPDDDLGWTEERGRDPVYIFEAVRKLKKAGISLQPDRHFGLGVKAYCQVTSPLRRYSDLIMQRQLHSVLTTGVSRYSDGDLLALMSVADQTSGIIKRICDDAEDYWALAYLEQNPGLVVQAVVLSTDRRSPLVLLTEYDVQARINPRREVSDGQRIALQVVHAQPRTGTLVLKEAD